MIVKTGLLILTNPVNLRKILPTIHKQVQNTLYIQLTNPNELLSRYKPETYNSPTKYSNVVRGIYADAAVLCANLDIRVILSNLKSSAETINTSQSIETVIFDTNHARKEIDSFIDNCITNKINDYNIWVWDVELANTDVGETPRNNQKVHNHVVLGGTFDRIHIGHKILLSEAILCAKKKVTIGVTDTNMNKSKLLWELILPTQTRIRNLRNLTTDLCPQLEYNIVPIQDPFGPTQSDPTMDLIVVSAETLRGGQKVNEIRKEKGLNPLEINCIDLIDSPCLEENEEAKISSSNERMRLLGSLLQTPKVLPKKFPYIIGLTGGIASGKSSVAKRLQELGALVLDCDKIAHESYKPGKPCYNLVVEAFGEQIIGENNEINRKVLGGIVFSDKTQMDRLNKITWPAIASEVQIILSTVPTHKIVILDAAILLSAGWDSMCHEVWCCIIQPEEAIKRIQNRNNLSEEEAKKRINAQISNSDVVGKCNVVLCTIWSLSYTQKMVDKAWAELRLRLKKE